MLATKLITDQEDYDNGVHVLLLLALSQELPISEVMETKRLRWYGHIRHKRAPDYDEEA